MVRSTVVLVSMIGAGCKGGSGGDDDGDSEPAVVLSTVSGEYDVDVNVVDDTCGGDVADVFRDFTIKMAQVSTGLSVLVDFDVGWVPCEGSVYAFDCQWGNAPTDDTESVWSWSLIGEASAQEVEATLTLEVTCSGGGGDCEPCSIVADYAGPFDPGNSARWSSRAGAW